MWNLCLQICTIQTCTWFILHLSCLCLVVIPRCLKTPLHFKNTSLPAQPTICPNKLHATLFVPSVLLSLCCFLYILSTILDKCFKPYLVFHFIQLEFIIYPQSRVLFSIFSVFFGCNSYTAYTVYTYIICIHSIYSINIYYTDNKTLLNLA